MNDDKIESTKSPENQGTEVKVVSNTNQTERFEQEVTINLEAEAVQNPSPGEVQNTSLHQIDELIKKCIDGEVTIFYMDYGAHIVQQLLSTISLVVVHNSSLELRYSVPAYAYFGSKVLYILATIRRLKKKRLLQVIYIAECVGSLAILGGLATFQMRVFLIPLLFYVLVFVGQVVAYCLNFADSIDQTFLFKLVCSSHLTSSSRCPR